MIRGNGGNVVSELRSGARPVLHAPSMYGLHVLRLVALGRGSPDGMPRFRLTLRSVRTTLG